MKVTDRFAVLIESIEPVFFNALKLKRGFVIVVKNSPLEQFAINNLPANRIIYVTLSNQKQTTLSFVELLKHSNLTSQLKLKGVNFFVVPYYIEPELAKWGQINKIKFLGTPAWLQQSLDNKKYFDNLLKKFNISSPETFKPLVLGQKLKAGQRWVAQEIKSYGMLGTKFITSNSALANFVKIQRKRLSRLLIRKYYDGLPLGISLFLDQEGNYFCSSARRQCFDYHQGFPQRFIGIQWLPRSFFNSLSAKKIQLMLSQLAELLKAEGFYGVANVDFLLHNNETYVLECNPRLSSATPQIFYQPGITQSKKPWDFYVNIFFRNKNKPIHIAGLPVSQYQGTHLDVNSIHGILIQNLPKVGIYRWHQNALKFVGHKIGSNLNKPNHLFIFHEHNQLGYLDKKETIAVVIGQKPLFHFKTGTLNNLGRLINRNLIKLFTL